MSLGLLVVDVAETALRPGRAEHGLCAQALAGGSPGTTGVCRFQRLASDWHHSQAGLEQGYDLVQVARGLDSCPVA
jgi:hypothetical protein